MARSRELLLRIVADTSDASKGIKKIQGDVGVLSKIGKIAGGIMVVGAVVEGVQAAITVVDDLTRAAREDAASQALLADALKQVGLEGYTAAAEKAATAAMDLGFADEEYRKALGLTARATGDFAASQEILTSAMDLAAAKGIDLETATTAITKAYQGSTGSLSRYGIQLEKGATGTEVLTALQGKFGTAAETAAGTSEGAWKRLGLQFGEVQEELGAKLLPIIDALASFLIEQVIPIVMEIIGELEKWFAVVSKELGPTIKELVAVLAELWKVLGPVIGFILSMVGAVLKLVAPYVLGYMRTVLSILIIILKGVAEAIGGVIRNISGLVSWIRDAIGWVQRLVSNLNPLRGFQMPDLNPFAASAAPSSFAGGLGGSAFAAPRAGGFASRSGSMPAGGVTINIYGGDPATVVDRTMQAIRTYGRQNGTALVIPGRG